MFSPPPLNGPLLITSPDLVAATQQHLGPQQVGPLILSRVCSRVRLHCRFRKRGTEYVRESGMKRMRGTVQSDNATEPNVPR